MLDVMKSQMKCPVIKKINVLPHLVVPIVSVQLLEMELLHVHALTLTLVNHHIVVQSVFQVASAC